MLWSLFVPPIDNPRTCTTRSSYLCHTPAPRLPLVPIAINGSHHASPDPEQKKPAVLSEVAGMVRRGNGDGVCQPRSLVLSTRLPISSSALSLDSSVIFHRTARARERERKQSNRETEKQMWPRQEMVSTTPPCQVSKARRSEGHRHPFVSFFGFATTPTRTSHGARAREREPEIGIERE
jgi:hypothetical protein